MERFDRDWLHSECERLKEHNTLEQFFGHLESFADRLEFFQLLYAAIPSFYEPGADRHPPVVHTTYDPDWMERYAERRHDLEDSALKHCLSGSETVYMWPRSWNFDRLSQGERKVFREANEAGIRHGFTLPMRNAFGGLGVLSLSFDGGEREFEKFHAARKEAAELFAYAFNEAVFGFVAGRFGTPHLPSLTPRERETLQWAAAGHTYDRTAERMRVGVGTVRKHMAGAIRKLKARNGTHACALALRWGLIG